MDVDVVEAIATSDAVQYGGLLHPDVPMHHQIYMQLRNEIEDGLWAGKAEFPGEEELASRFDVSIITSRRALTRLSEEGYVRRERGRRPRISYDPDNARRSDPAPTMLPLGARPFEYTILDSGIGIVPAEACRAFGVPLGTPLWSVNRLRSFDGRRHSVAQSVQRPETGTLFTHEDLVRLPMAQLLGGLGIKPAKLQRRLGIAYPSASAARSLQISLQDRTIVYTYVLIDDREEPVDWVRIYIHPDETLPSETMNLQDHTWESLEVI